MNLRISALEKVARIGCKYDLSFLLYSCWALPSGGCAEGQLALSSPLLHMWILGYKLLKGHNIRDFFLKMYCEKFGQLSETLHVLR